MDGLVAVTLKAILTVLFSGLNRSLKNAELAQTIHLFNRLVELVDQNKKARSTSVN